MSDKHLSTQFDSELNGVSSRVMELGGLVESQIRQAIYAFTHFSAEAAEEVFEIEGRVNQMEIPAPADGARPAAADRHFQDHGQPGAGR